MRTNLQAANRFAAVSDVRHVPDPWGLGVTFWVVRDGAQRLERWRRERLAANPLARLMAETAMKLQFERACAGGALSPEQEAAIVKANAAAIEFSPDQLDKMSEEALLDVVQRIAGWEGLTTPEGEVIPFSADAARELLSTEDLEVPSDEEYGGQSLGLALRAFVLTESRRAESYRSAVVEGAAGN